MKTFKTKTYYIPIKKLKGQDSVKLAFLSDLHGLMFGEENEELLRRIILGAPDAVLVGGDMAYSSNEDSLEMTTGFLCRLAKELPVYYALGNHESRMMADPAMQEKYFRFEDLLSDAGTCFLHNRHVSMKIHGTDFVFYGLELPLEYYRKPKPPSLSLMEMETLIGSPSKEGIQVLLAHNPRYGNTYFSWGADLIFSGHYHGGVVRFTENRGLISPHFQLFPGFCCGEYRRGKSHMIVSAGLGEHTIPVRIHNPRELVFAELLPGE